MQVHTPALRSLVLGGVAACAESTPKEYLTAVSTAPQFQVIVSFCVVIEKKPAKLLVEKGSLSLIGFVHLEGGLYRLSC
jgi:hypothetical protein